MRIPNFKIDDKRTARLLAWLCSLTYLGSYLTRKSFAACQVSILSDMGLDDLAIIAPVTVGLFITYGAGQLVSGKLCDKFDPYKIAAIGLLSSIIMNLCIPFCSTVWQMTVIWSINGFAQSMMWPPIVNILANHCHTEDYQRASVIVSWGGMAGTVTAYLVSSASIALVGWKAMFFTDVIITLLIWLAWVIGYPAIMRRAEHSIEEQQHKTEIEQPRAATSSMPRKLYFVLIPVLGAAVVLGALRDSIESWLPNYIKETFSMGDSSAVLSGIIIPIITMAVYPLVLKFYRKFFTNELTCAATVYAMSIACSVLLYFTYATSPFISIVLLALVCAAMHGVNFLLIVLVPKRFSRFGNVGTLSGLLNSFVYVGSSISIYGIAKIVDETDNWQVAVAVWAIACATGIVLCLSVSRGWNKIFGNKKK